MTPVCAASIGGWSSWFYLGGIQLFHGAQEGGRTFPHRTRRDIQCLLLSTGLLDPDPGGWRMFGLAAAPVGWWSWAGKMHPRLVLAEGDENPTGSLEENPNMGINALLRVELLPEQGVVEQQDLGAATFIWGWRRP